MEWKKVALKYLQLNEDCTPEQWLKKAEETTELVISGYYAEIDLCRRCMKRVQKQFDDEEKKENKNENN